MIGLFDRDVFLKLACCDLWAEALEVLGVTQPMRLASTSSTKSNARILARWFSDPDDLTNIEARLSTMLEQVPIVTDELVDKAEASESFARLADTDDIDAGEQILLSIVIDDHEQNVLITGDKRCVKALAGAFPDDRAKVGASLISFERCLCEIEKKYGFDLIHKKAYAACSCDGSLKLAFGSNPNADDFRAALASFDPLAATAEVALQPQLV
ncbi:hypothetical protein [Bradyrhizobium japonicum]|uniref:hypothetical protein n=1 Tax=Bradyrhizobium japonicum TaxID=375 RepID=UPI00200D2014|nr:hypothetical protein [Bradyrhizobium japonicum]UQD95222.1 hypothetical protein JEY30_26745 [Bradyrhizobium japonicum]